MNVGRLIEILKEYENDTVVLISCDEEGNGFNGLDYINLSHYTQDGYKFEVYHPDDIEERRQEALNDGEDYQEPPKALVLWP